MKKIQSSEIKPVGNNLSVEIKITEKEINGVKTGKKLASKVKTEQYMGKVLAIGRSVKDKTQCPELEVGDYIIFDQFAGAVANTEDCYTKVIDGYNVLAISKEEDMNKDTIKPANDRILVEILNENFSVNGLEYENSIDPRDKVTQKGLVLKCGVNVEDVVEGEVVFFEPYAGNLIVNETDLKLKTLNYRDILYKI
jgi:co-chaperonin GroES (HSP10)